MSIEYDEGGGKRKEEGRESPSNLISYYNEQLIPSYFVCILYCGVCIICVLCILKTSTYTYCR
jgi:hypothetical protein